MPREQLLLSGCYMLHGKVAMEQAILVTRLASLKHLKKKYRRLYYGSEFCERLIPGPAEVRRAASFAWERGMGFSLVTPYVTNSGLEKLRKVFASLANGHICCEVIVNDWGVLELLNRRYPGFEPVLGRLLTKQKRGPTVVQLLQRKKSSPLFKFFPGDPSRRLIILGKSIPAALDPYYKGSNAASVPVIHRFLNSRGIRRIELDNTGQGLSLELPRGRISASVYFPFVYIATTFYCPSADCDAGRSSFLKIKPCKQQCRKYFFILRNRSLHKPIFLKGNTQFYKNSVINPKTLAAAGVDRIVYESELCT
jgi:hypothetical protein